MSAASPNDPRQQGSVPSDEALRQAHSAEHKEPSGHRIGMPIGLALAFAAVAYLSGIYLDRYSAHFSPLAYNEAAPAPGAAALAPKPVDPVALGKKQFAAACVTCHQANGLGVPGTYPPLVGSEWVTGSEERVIRIVLHGLNQEIKVGDKVFNGVMPSFGKVPGSGYNWRDDQVAAVITYIRQEWGNKAPAVTAEKVAEIRAKENRDKAWTAAELLQLP